MRFEIVNEDVRYLRDYCPITASSVTGTGPGAVCRCECEPPPPIPPVQPKPQCCAIKVKVGSLVRYRPNNGSANLKVCC